MGKCGSQVALPDPVPYVQDVPKFRIACDTCDDDKFHDCGMMRHYAAKMKMKRVSEDPVEDMI